MRCPKCGCLSDKVVDSRISKQGESIRRRRECMDCAYRFTTRESISRGDLVVVKRDGVREDFDQEKMRRGIELACWKRSVRGPQIEKLVDSITAELLKRFEREVPSKVVGELVMEGLQSIDEIAYVRFASVYRRFKRIDEFIDEVQNLTEAHGGHSDDPNNDGSRSSQA